MKHALLLIFVAVVGYLLYELSPARERSRGLSFLARHVFRLGGIVLLVLALLILAAYFPSTAILWSQP